MLCRRVALGTQPSAVQASKCWHEACSALLTWQAQAERAAACAPARSVDALAPCHITHACMQGRAEGAPWVAALEHAEYDELSLEARVAALSALVHLALEGPSVRACLDGRLEEAQRVRKLMWEDAKARRAARPCDLISIDMTHHRTCLLCVATASCSRRSSLALAHANAVLGVVCDVSCMASARWQRRARL